MDGEDNFAMLLSVLRDDSNSNILSTPSAVVMDNEEASLLVGQEIPITTGESLGTNNLTPFRTTAREEIGIKLEVKPQINEADSVALFIRQEVSSIAGSQLPNSSDLISLNWFQSHNIYKRSRSYCQILYINNKKGCSDDRTL